MTWRNVVITKHCKISTKLKLLVVQTDDDVYQFPLDDLGTVMISTTQAVVTANAMANLLKRDVKVIFCDEKHLPIGETNPYETESSRRSCIIQQMCWLEERRNILWQRIVQEKIAHQMQVLERCCPCPDVEKIGTLAADVKSGILTTVRLLPHICISRGYLRTNSSDLTTTIR